MAENIGPANDELLRASGASIPSTPVAPDPPPAPSRPNITPAQIVGLIPVVASLLRAFGVYDLNHAEQDALSNAVTGGLALFGADAIIRFGRNLAHRL